MKITNKLKMILLFVLSFIALTCCITGFSVAAKQVKDYEFVLSNEFESFYQVGDELVVPSAVVTNGSKEYVASVMVVLPDKTVTNNKNIPLTNAGNYLVEYVAYVEEEQWYLTKSFDIVVNQSLFSVIGEGNIDYVNYNDNIKGVVATMYKGDTFTFNDYIDLKELNGAVLFKMMAYPQIIGEADANKLIIKITDVYDENKFVTVRVKKSEETSEGKEWGWYASYVDANYSVGTYDSPFIGMNYNEAGKYTCNGQKYSIYKNSESYGTETNISLTGGVKGNASISSKTYGLSYDYNKNQLHSTLFTGSSSNKQLISNFADINIFSQLFEGFTDGKVKISITPENFNKSYCKLIFTEFAGRTILEDGYNTFVYKQAPKIDVDFGEYTEETVPNGLPNIAYEVYKATAFDFIDGDVDVETKVYFGYSNKHKVSIDVVEGKFIPKHGGIYTIEYKVKNSFGNTTIKTVDILILSKTASLSFTINDFVDSGFVGQEIKLLSGYEAENYYGNTSLEAIVELSSDSSIKYELSEQNEFAFKPLHAGVYNVKLMCSDYVETVFEYKTIEIEADEVVMYSVEGFFPHYFIKNGTYDLPEVFSTELSTGNPISVPTELYVVKSDNSETKSDGTLLVSDNDFIKLSYRPVGISWAQPYEVTIPVLDTGLGTSKIIKQDYFVSTKGEWSKGSSNEDVYYSVDKLDNGVTSLEFANILQGHNFFISLSPYIDNGEYKQIESINIVLSDVLDVNRFVKLSINVKNNGVFFTVNDNKETKVADSWGNASDIITINYDILSSLVNVNSSYDILAENFFGLSEAVVFEEGLFAELSIKAATTNCGLRITTVNDQLLSSSARDRNAPIIDSSMNNNKGEYELNNVVTFLPYKVYDVLSPTVEFSFYIKKPNGDFAVATDGTILNGQQDVEGTYYLKLEEYGEYEVYPVAVDVINEISNNNTSYKISVIDKVLPVITLNKHTTSATVNKAFTIATYSIDKPNCISFVTILTPDGIYQIIKDKKYTPKTKGKYVITITAIDESDNIAHNDYTVIVK